jgi:hypothetical protein
MKGRRLIGFIVVLLILGGVAAGVLVLLSGDPVLVKTVRSPQGDYVLEVWENPQFAHLPGDALSGDGYIVLRDSNDDVVTKMDVELVSSVAKVYWMEDFVDVVGVGILSYRTGR